MLDFLQDYRQILRAQLAERCQKNPAYSLRAFARDLQVPPSRLSEVMGAKRGLSKEAGLKIARRLGFSANERELFVLQIEAAHARSDARKKEARRLLLDKRREVDASDKPLTLDAFQVISDWQHYAILELCTVENFDSSIDAIAKRLGLSRVETELSVERLKRLELLEEREGQLRPREEQTISPNGIPSEAIRKFHRQMLGKAEQALTLQSVEERDFSSITLAVDAERLTEAKDLIRRFRREFATLMSSGEKKNRVYNLSIQFFGVDQARSSS